MWQKQELQILTGFQVIWITAGRVRSGVMLKWSKEMPNMVLIHIVVGSYYIPVCHYQGFLKILQETGEDLVYQAGACAMLVTAQMQAIFCIVSNSFCAG